jgi:hypothetical protein
VKSGRLKAAKTKAALWDPRDLVDLWVDSHQNVI